jgi:hypothetical protein
MFLCQEKSKDCEWWKERWHEELINKKEKVDWEEVTLIIRPSAVWSVKMVLNCCSITVLSQRAIHLVAHEIALFTVPQCPRDHLTFLRRENDALLTHTTGQEEVAEIVTKGVFGRAFGLS